MENWGFCIKKLRKEAGLTQPELAKRSGLTREHISRMELGHFQGWKQVTLEKLAHGLSMSTIQLCKVIYDGNGKESSYSAISEIKRKLRYLENELKESEK